MRYNEATRELLALGIRMGYYRRMMHLQDTSLLLRVIYFNEPQRCYQLQRNFGTKNLLSAF